MSNQGRPENKAQSTYELHLSPTRRGLLQFMILAAALGSGPPAALAAEPLRIAAAADLQPVLPSILADFSRQTGIAAEASYQSSATLTLQIENGAGFDLFLSADTSFPQRLIAAGLAQQQAPVIYAQGTLVLWARKDAPLLASRPISLECLHSPALHTLAIANPEHAPYGRAARAALTSLGLLPALTPKLVTAENIAQAAQFASTGNADAGLISLTSAIALGTQGVYVAVPASAYPPILQGAVLLKRAAPSARRFLDYLATPAVRQTLAKRGLAVPSSP
ncbi:MAG TPA: molybdate ABC transporter substrate-binding protein [Acidobacteriaceae bacterium]